MTDEKKKVGPQLIVSPLGKAAYAWINLPDVKFDPLKPTYKCTLVLDDNEVSRAFCEKIETLGRAHAVEEKIKLKKMARMPFSLPEDDEEDEDSPLKEEFVGKIRVEGKSKFKPKQIDAKMNEMGENVFVMSGDDIKVRFRVSSYDGFGGGVTCKLDMLQLINKNAGASSQGTDGFDEEEGYEEPAAPEAPAEEDDDDDVPY